MAHLVQAEHQHLLIELPSKVIKKVSLDQKQSQGSSTISLGKFGSFKVDDIVGRPYGQTVEIVENGLQAINLGGTLASVEEENGSDVDGEIDGDGDIELDHFRGQGEHILAQAQAQTLSMQDVEELKKTAGHSDEIVDKLIESHLAFALKNGYSKEKYQRKKEAKYRKRFRILEPSLANVAQFYLDREPMRIRELTAQVLGYMCTAVDVGPASRSLVVDDAKGLLLAAVMQRTGEEGRIIALHDNDVPSHESLELFNFPPDLLKIYLPLAWNVTQETWKPTGYLVAPDPVGDPVEASKKRKRRKTAGDRICEIRQDFFDGEFEHCLVSTHFDPSKVIKRITPFLAGSASLAVHSPFLEPLTEASEELRQSDQYINVHLTELFLREYQILPGRSHPLMSMPGGSGYILTAVRVIPDEDRYSSELERKSRMYGTGSHAKPSTSQDG